MTQLTLEIAIKQYDDATDIEAAIPAIEDEIDQLQKQIKSKRRQIEEIRDAAYRTRQAARNRQRVNA